MDLAQITKVNAIITQGDAHDDDMRVTEFKVAYQTSRSADYEYVRRRNDGQINVHVGVLHCIIW